MKIEFRYNSTNQLILTPENKKDEQLIQLFVGGFKCVKFGQPPAASPTTLVMESFNVPTVDDTTHRVFDNEDVLHALQESNIANDWVKANSEKA